MRRLAVQARRAARRVRWAVQDRRLESEQRRGELGPAHLRWKDNSSTENRRRWSGYDWSGAGDEWNASPEWKQALIKDVLECWIPAGVVTLEIGPGGGRWSEALIARASQLILVDVSERPLELCRERFAGQDQVTYILSHGSDLPGVADDSVQAVWSFDVFVHVAPRDQARYLDEIARVLTPGGVAVIHHADGQNRGLQPARMGWRAPMSRGLFAALARDRGLVVDAQFDAWGPDRRHDLSAYGDAITVVRRTNPD
jgi:SAM-dependent methyltransferase